MIFIMHHGHVGSLYIWYSRYDLILYCTQVHTGLLWMLNMLWFIMDNSTWKSECCVLYWRIKRFRWMAGTTWPCHESRIIRSSTRESKQEACLSQEQMKKKDWIVHIIHIIPVSYVAYTKALCKVLLIKNDYVSLVPLINPFMESLICN